MTLPVNNFPGYCVDSTGLVLHKGKCLKPSVQPSGYVKIYLYRDGKRHVKYLHRIVAEAFIDNPNNLPEVNHKDGNRANCRVDNLEWIDRVGNMRHGKGRAVHQVKDGIIIKTFETISQAAIEVGDKSNGANIYQCANGNRRTAYGYSWVFTDA